MKGMCKGFLSILLLMLCAVSVSAGQGAAAAAADPRPPGPPREITVLSFTGAEVVKAFNAADGNVRLVVLFSPT
ncbi:MAG: hypothetical protein ACR2L2_03415 [Acidobacteriota bacterium]